MTATPTSGADQRLIDPVEARRRVLGRVEPLPAEEVPLREALGRVLAEEVIGRRARRATRAAAPGGMRNANVYSVAAQTVEAGAELVLTDTVADDYGTIAAAIRDALELDVVVICGGMSVGAHDHVRHALAELEVERVFFGVALRPGKPAWFGVHRGCGDRGGGTLVFGLPGNPVAAMVTLHLFARPALDTLAGTSSEKVTMPAIMAQDYPKAPGRARAVRCETELHPGGRGR